MPIHPTAIVHRGAEIDSSAHIGPYCVIGPRTKIGAETHLLSHVVVENHTTIGSRNVLHPFACIGGVPQDKKYRGEASHLLIGDDNIIREYVTLNIGTENGHMQTTVGNGCLLMASSHVAHDCVVGHGVVIANGVALAGHVELGDKAILGGLAAVHQYCRVGRLAFVGGGAMVAQDVPPFCVAQGDRATLAGINLVGLRRAGWTRAQVGDLRRAIRQLFFGEGSRTQGLELTESTFAAHSEQIAELCAFVRSAPRGVCSPRLKGDAMVDLGDDESDASA